MKIAHIADIHIRPYSRHSEYLEVFDNLYKSLEQQKPDRIAIVGDILHNKISVSPELIDITANFFKRLASIAPLDITLGNHDLSLNAKYKLDAITPIINAVDHHNIHFMKHSGIYPIDENTNYVVMSCVDEESKWLKYEDLSEKDRNKNNIALFHGAIDGTVLDNGFRLESEYKLSLFKGFDYVLLGDIHKAAVLDEDCRIAYCGSTVQQNFSEGLKHGYFLWNIQSKQEHDLDFIELPNVCPFYTIELKDDLVLPKDLQFQQKARIRVLSRELTVAEEKELKTEIKEKFNPVELKFVDRENIVSKDIKVSKNLVKIENLRNIEVQEKLIQEHLKEHKLSKEVLEKIYDINRDLDAQLTKNEETLRNIRYKLKYLKFSNLFSYGADNEIDFDNLKGIVGVLGKNGSGKSSLAVDIPLYTMYNKISKDVVKNNLYINQNETQAYSELGIEVLNDLYIINRSTEIKYSKKGNEVLEKGITELDFYVLKNGNEKVELQGAERAETDKNIKKYFGTYDDYMLTNLAAQFDLLAFLRTKNTDRKKIISRYFDLDIFQEKYQLANEQLKLLKKQINSYEGKDYSKLIEECRATLDNNKAQIEHLNKELNDFLDKKEKCSKKIWELDYKDNDYSKEETQITIKVKSIENRISSLQSELSDFDKYVCLSNPNCCMLIRKRDVIEKLEKEKINKQKAETLLEEIQKKKEANNKEKEEKSKKLSNLLSQIESNISRINRELSSYNQQEGALKLKIELYEKEGEEYLKVKKEYDAYYYYAKAMGKDGISYGIISQNIVYLNKEIKKLLANDAGFDVFLEDNDKDIEIYFKHKKNKKRLIELCSGMERSLAAIAIRVALNSITSLPCSNVLVLDEPFSNLDVEYLEVAGKMLQLLKNYYSTILIISHDDSVKDLVEQSIFIERDGKGYSRIHI